MPEFKTYVFEYRYKGSLWGGQLKAQSFKDAENRLHNMAHGKVLGELMGTVPAIGPTGLIVRFICWLRNTGRLLFSNAS